MSDLHGDLLVNHAARQLFFPGISLDKALRPDDFQQKLGAAFDMQKAIDSCIKRKKANNYPLVMYKNNYYHISAAPVIEGGKPIGCVLLIEDITEEKVLQRSRDEFFSIASHELRTPLTAIRGNTSMVLQYYPEINHNNDLKEIIGDVYESSVRLIDIVNDFLETSRIEQGKMEFNFQDVAVDKIVESVTYEMHSLIEHRKLFIKQDKTLGKLPLVRADPNRLKQVIYNVLGNAVKFTDKGGITVSAFVHAKKLELYVADTGRGIPLENQKLLFHKFQQANTSLYTRDTTRGTGLGLYISKLIMTNMKGSIALEKSTPDVGTVFVLTLPLTKPD
jgi:signal transduction histidine kinase